MNHDKNLKFALQDYFVRLTTPLIIHNTVEHSALHFGESQIHLARKRCKEISTWLVLFPATRIEVWNYWLERTGVPREGVGKPHTTYY